MSILLQLTIIILYSNLKIIILCRMLIFVRHKILQKLIISKYIKKFIIIIEIFIIIKIDIH
jgi:hypothetical protein